MIPNGSAHVPRDCWRALTKSSAVSSSHFGESDWAGQRAAARATQRLKVIRGMPHCNKGDVPDLIRGLGLVESIALNMSNMVGVGPFITIPLIIAAMGGPQCMLGWVLGAILALCDGLVWSELSAAIPGSGGTYAYLREAFRGTRFGGLMPFLFIWQFILSGPLEIGCGYIGFAQYGGYFWRGMGIGGARRVGISLGVLVVWMLYRRITAVGRLTVVLWAGMLVTALWVIVSGLGNYHPKVAFDFPPGAFRFSTGFAAGL